MRHDEPRDQLRERARKRRSITLSGARAASEFGRGGRGITRSAHDGRRRVASDQPVTDVTRTTARTP
jgi:hypothetical protein